MQNSINRKFHKNLEAILNCKFLNTKYYYSELIAVNNIVIKCNKIPNAQNIL